MTQSNSVASSSLPVPEYVGELFANRPLLLGESPELYDTLLSRVAAEAKPEDTIERLLLRDVVDLTWEIQRFRKIHTTIIQNSMEARVISKMKLALSRAANADVVESAEPATAEPEIDHDDLARRYFAGDSEARREIEAMLAEQGIELDSESSLMTSVYLDNESNLDFIDRMIAAAEARRERMLRLFHGRRLGFGIRVRHALDRENESEIAQQNAPRQLVAAHESAT
jgi:hypothetical protein